MPHPNQLALPVATARWIDQSQHLSDDLAIERLGEKLATITDALNIVSSDVDELPPEMAGLSSIDLMAAQASLTVELRVRRRFAGMAVAA